MWLLHVLLMVILLQENNQTTTYITGAKHVAQTFCPCSLRAKKIEQ